MNKKILIAALLVGSVFSTSNSSFAYTVAGAAVLTPTGSSGNSFNLSCPGQGTCYTNAGGVVEIYLAGGNKICRLIGNPVLVPNPDGTFTQIGEVEVEVE